MKSIDRARLTLWKAGKIEYLLHSGQQLILKSIQDQEGDEVILLCSRRFGKSYFSLMYLAMQCLKKTKFRGVIIAESKEQARNIILPIVEWLESQAPTGLIKKTTSKFVIKFHNGSEIHISGADSMKDSIRGQGFDMAILEESCQWNPQTADYLLKSVIKPMLLHSQEKIKVLHATTPSQKNIDHPFHLKIGNITTIKLTIFDNPLLSQEQVTQAIDDCGGIDSPSFQIEYLCNIVRNEQFSVLPNYKDEPFELPILIAPKLGSLDTGGVRDNTAFVTLQQGQDSLYYISIAKQWRPHTTIQEYVDYIKEQSCEFVIADAAGQTQVEMNNKGLSTIFPLKTDRDTAIKELDLAFRKGLLHILPEGLELKECLSSATWNSTRTDFERSDKFGHADYLMACVYAWRMRFMLDAHIKKLGILEERAKIEFDYNNPQRYTRPLPACGMEQVAKRLTTFTRKRK